MGGVFPHWLCGKGHKFKMDGSMAPCGSMSHYYPYYYPLLKYLPLLPLGAGSLAQAFYFAGLLQFFQHKPDHISADPRASFFQVRKGELACKSIDGVLDQGGLGSARILNFPSPVFKLQIRSANDREEIIKPWNDIMAALMPVFGTFVKDSIIIFL